MLNRSATAVADQPTLALAQLLEQAVRGFYPDRGPSEMHPGQWAALRYLARANAEARTIAGLGRFLGMTIGPASRAAAALERKGLIVAQADPVDKRIRRLSLTAEGEALLTDDPLRVVAGRLSQLPSSQREALRSAVLTLVTGQSTAGNDPFVVAEDVVA